MITLQVLKVGFRKSFRILKKHLIALIILIPLLALSTIIIPLVCSIYLYRFCLSKLSILNPSLGKMLPTRSALLTTDWPYDRPLFNLTVKLTFKETLNLEQIRSLIETKWINATCSDSGHLKYPELRQYVSKWMGFTFWKSEQNFSVERHIYERQLKTKEELEKLIDEIILKPFEEKTSPWRGILVQILREKECSQTVAILSWHHCMWDGFATISLFSELSHTEIHKCEYSNRKEDFERYKKTHYDTLWKKLFFIIKAPYEVILANVDSYDPVKSNSWHLPNKQLQRVWKTASAKKEIDIELIKEVKVKFGVSFTSVLTAGMTAATRNLMMKNPHRVVPAFINCGFPLPLPRESEKLRNFWALTTLKLPVGQEDQITRLYKIDRRLQRLKGSTMPIMSILLLPLLGGLFSWMLKFIFSNRHTSMVISIMPGISEELKDSSGKITAEGMAFYISLAQGNAGFGISALSYNGKITTCATVDRGIENQNDLVQQLTDDVEKEIRELLALPIKIEQV